MKFQLTVSSGFAKLAKIKDKDKQIEIPTTMTVNKSGERIFWQIGEEDNYFTMNIPQSSIKPNSSEKFVDDYANVANIFMHKTVDKSIIDRHLSATKEALPKIIESLNIEKVAITIQPTDSNETLKQVLQIISDFEIRNIAITNFLPLLNRPRQATTFLGTIKEQLPIDTILYLLSPIPHTFIPIFAYAGIDVFNTDFAKIAAKQSFYLTDFSGKQLDRIKELPCFCEACTSVDKITNLLKKDPQNSNSTFLEKHNKMMLAKKIREIRNAIRNQELRSYIEQMVHSNVFSGTALRLLDKYYSDLFISRTATWQTAPINHITTYSFYRPAIQGFQRRMLDRYKIPDKKKIVVIFPCSARKPYSQSKSHKKFLNTLDSLDKRKGGYIQELILTSPLGVIPRELETVYPAAHYDIPVTGDWSFEEKEIAVYQLTGVLEKAKKLKMTVIAHVSDEYIELCEETEKNLKMKFKYTSLKSKATSQISLSDLSKELSKLLEKLPPITNYSDVDKIRTIADYQFGLGIGEGLFNEKCRLRGKPRQPLLVMRERKQLGVIHQETGQLTLSIETGNVLAKKPKYHVIFEGKELQGSTLFAVGVVDADLDIRPSDAVVVLNVDKELVGVGQALVSGFDMKHMRSGPVVKIKQKV